MALTTVQTQMLGTGAVLQVVSTSITAGSASTTNTSFTSSGFSLSITPKFATSKVFVCVSFAHQGAGSNPNVLSTVYRNSTNIFNTSTANQLYANTITNLIVPVTLTTLDSPATTSSTTYTIYHLAIPGFGGSSIINTVYGPVNITLMEIAG